MILGRLISIVAVGTALAVLGCDSSATDKAGGEPAVEPKVLTLANGNYGLGAVQVWADEVARLSSGRLRIRPRNDWREGDPHYEAGLIRDVEAGGADLGWVGSRAWTARGVRGLDALHAPFLIDDYGLQEEILGAPIAERMLASISRAGVEPVALLPGPLRWLLARQPVEGPADLSGLTIRVAESEVAAATLRRLGASAKPVASGIATADADGVEQQLEALAGSWSEHFRHLTADLPLWPRPVVVFASRDAWAGLDEAERDVLRRAAGRVLGEMTEGERAGERDGLRGLCAAGARLALAGPKGRAGFRRAVEPVYQRLRRDALTREAFVFIERARARRSASIDKPSCPDRPRESGGLPNGTYHATFRRGEPGAADIPPGFVGGAGKVRFELLLEPGRARLFERYEDGRVETGFDETYTVYRDRINFSGAGDLDFSARWRLDESRLTFTDFVSAEAIDRIVWGTHPWIRDR